MERFLGVDAAELRERLRVFTTLGRAARRYRPQASFRGPTYLVAPNPNEPRQTWNGKLAHATCVTVDGDHYSILRHPGVDAVARALQKILARPR
jgi:hypothetical protein